MHHPASRAERRATRQAYVAYRRRIMKNWSAYSNRQGIAYAADNLWWQRCAKHNGSHGGCICRPEKHSGKLIRKRRRSLDDEIGFNILSFADALDRVPVRGYCKKPR